MKKPFYPPEPPTAGAATCDRIYPYIVTADYPIDGADANSGLAYPLGQGRYVTLVYATDGLVRNVREADLLGEMLSPEQAHAKARDNLQKFFDSGEIESEVLPGPRDARFVRLIGHWLASACGLLPELFTFAAKNLQTEALLVCMPHRDALYVFPAGDAELQAEMAALIRDESEVARKLLSFEAFSFPRGGLGHVE